LKLTKPMLLGYQEDPFDSPLYIAEPKWNGVRLLHSNTIYTRHLNVITDKLPELHTFQDGLLLDGELISKGEEKIDDFEAVMSRISLSNKQRIKFAATNHPLSYLVFDILTHKNKTLYSVPLMERKKLLASVIKEISNPQIVMTDFIESEGLKMFDIVKEHSLEGMVMKRKDSFYQPGKRSNDWLKIINWTFTKAFISSITFSPLTLQLTDYEDKYMGSIRLGISSLQRKVIIDHFALHKKKIPCTVKSRGHTKKGLLNIPLLYKFDH
jgi:DNA ligase-1